MTATAELAEDPEASWRRPVRVLSAAHELISEFGQVEAHVVNRQLADAVWRGGVGTPADKHDVVVAVRLRHGDRRVSEVVPEQLGSWRPVNVTSARLMRRRDLGPMEVYLKIGGRNSGGLLTKLGVALEDLGKEATVGSSCTKITSARRQA